MQVLAPHQVDIPAAEERGELSLELEDAEAEDHAGLEVDQQIDIALQPEVRAERRAEERELANPPAAAKAGQLDRVDCDTGRRRSGCHASSLEDLRRFAARQDRKRRQSNVPADSLLGAEQSGVSTSSLRLSGV